RRRSGAAPDRTFPSPRARAAGRLASRACRGAPRTWRARARSRRGIGRRHPDGEARAQDPAIRGVSVGGGDRTSVGLHELPADRQPKPGMLAKMLGRPLRVEALEDRLQVLLGNARTFVLDRDDECTGTRLATELDDEARARRTERQ